MQRNFELTRKQVEAWRAAELTTVAPKMITYEAFIESELEARTLFLSTRISERAHHLESVERVQLCLPRRSTPSPSSRTRLTGNFWPVIGNGTAVRFD